MPGDLTSDQTLKLDDALGWTALPLLHGLAGDTERFADFSRAAAQADCIEEDGVAHGSRSKLCFRPWSSPILTQSSLDRCKPAFQHSCMSSLAERIKERREHLGLTQEQVGRHFGISREAVLQWEKKEDGTAPRGKRLRELADLLECSLQWLLTGEASTIEAPEQPVVTRIGSPPGYVPVQHITLGAGAGAGRMAIEYQESFGPPKYYEEDLIRRELRGRPADFRTIEIAGPSMEPLLQNRDQVLIDTRLTSVIEPGLFVVDDGDGIVCKWVERAHGSDPPRIRLKSENPRFDVYEVEAERARILGRVVWFARRL